MTPMPRNDAAMKVGREKKCYYDTPLCKGVLWRCRSCGEWFCQLHFHETSKGRNVECVACERERLKLEKQ